VDAALSFAERIEINLTKLRQDHRVLKLEGPIALSVPRKWPRQCDPVENFADKKVSLNGGQVFSYDLIVEAQAKQASRVAWSFKLNDDPLD
jgi:hypothetical protein